MNEVLAQAPEVSPWWGLDDSPGFSWEIVQRLDDLDAAQRMLLVKRFRGLKRREKDVLEALASRGWSAKHTYPWLQWATDRSQSSIGHALAELEKAGYILKPVPIIAKDGSRTYLITIAGEAILRGYAAHREEPLDVTSSEAAPAHREEPLDVTSSEAAPDIPTGSLEERFPDTPEPQGSASLDVTSSPSRVPARAPAPPPPPAGAVSQSVSIQDIDQEIYETDGLTTPARPRAPASPPPDWWPIFLKALDRLLVDRRRPHWREVMVLPHPGDDCLEMLREACGIVLDTYGQYKRPAIRRARGPIRAIYQSLMSDALALPGGVAEYLRDYAWAGDAYCRLPDPVPAQTPALIRRAVSYRQTRLNSEQPEGETRPPTAQEIWGAVLGEMQMQLPRPTFETWLKPTEGAGFDDDEAGEVLVVTAPTPFAVEWLERRMFHALQGATEKVLEAPVRLRLEVAVLEEP